MLVPISSTNTSRPALSLSSGARRAADGSSERRWVGCRRLRAQRGAGQGWAYRGGLVEIGVSPIGECTPHRTGAMPNLRESTS